MAFYINNKGEIVQQITLTTFEKDGKLFISCDDLINWFIENKKILTDQDLKQLMDDIIEALEELK